MAIASHRTRRCAVLLGAASLGAIAVPAAAHAGTTLDRNGSYVSIEPYGSNIVRITLAQTAAEADAPPGYGIDGKPDDAGWTHNAGADGDTFASSQLSVTVDPQPWPKAPTQMERYFAPALPPVSLTVKDAVGHVLTRMNGWQMAPHTVNTEDTFQVGASFAAPADEHYYGLGQQQQGILDLKGRTIDCKHWYDAPAGETVCVPY
ncbi:MAG: alpha-glucosidase, partial [Sphingomonas sp.]